MVSVVGRRLIRLGLTLALALQLIVTYFSQHPGSFPATVPNSSLWILPTAAPYLLGLALLARAEFRPRTVVTLVLGLTATLQVLALTRLPRTSNDVLRYIWDGKVQLAGIDPYRYAPDDPGLVRLHEPLLFTHAACALPTGCPLLNRPDVHTIYPPVAQAAFDLVRLITLGGHGGERAFQIAAAVGALTITGLLLRHARRNQLPLWTAAAWGWCPIVVSEFGNNAHIDWLAILLSLLGISAYASARPRWAGALVGAAIAVKLYPALILPSLLKRHPIKVISAAATVVVLGYVPHLLVAGRAVVGFLPGYLQQEGYASGSRLILLSLLLPRPFDSLVGVLLLAAVALRCYQRSDSLRPELTAVMLCGATFLVVTPGYGWYGAILIALIAMTAHWEWLPIGFAPSASYLYGPLFRDRHLSDAITWLIAVSLGVAIWYLRCRRSPTVENQSFSTMKSQPTSGLPPVGDQ